MLNSVVRQQIHALPKGSSAKTTRPSISESVNQIKVWPRVQMLLGQTGLTPQNIHSIPRMLDRPQHSDQAPRAMMFFPAPKIVPKVSHRFSNARIIQVSTSESIFGKSTFSPQRLTTAIPKLQKSKENPSTHLEMHRIVCICTTVSEYAN